MAMGNSEVAEKVKAIMAEEGGPLSKFLLIKELLIAAKVGFYTTIAWCTLRTGGGWASIILMPIRPATRFTRSELICPS